MCAGAHGRKTFPPGRRASGPERGPLGSFIREGEHSISSASGSVVWTGCLRVLFLCCFVVILLVVQAGAQSTVFYWQVVVSLTSFICVSDSILFVHVEVLQVFGPPNCRFLCCCPPQALCLLWC